MKKEAEYKEKCNDCFQRIKDVRFPSKALNQHERREV
jgi:hypothetical protein